MPNADQFDHTNSTYHAHRLPDGHIAFSRGGPGITITLDGALETIHLNVTQDHYLAIRAQAAQGKLDFASLKQRYAKPTKDSQAHERIEKNPR